MSDECRFEREPHLAGYHFVCRAHNDSEPADVCTHAAAALQGRVNELTRERDIALTNAAGFEAQSRLWARKALEAEARVRELEAQVLGLTPDSDEPALAYRPKSQGGGLDGIVVGDHLYTAGEAVERVRELEATLAAYRTGLSRAEQTVARLREALEGLVYHSDNCVGHRYCAEDVVTLFAAARAALAEAEETK